MEKLSKNHKKLIRTIFKFNTWYVRLDQLTNTLNWSDIKIQEVLNSLKQRWNTIEIKSENNAVDQKWVGIHNSAYIVFMQHIDHVRYFWLEVRQSTKYFWDYLYSQELTMIKKHSLIISKFTNL